MYYNLFSYLSADGYQVVSRNFFGKEVTTNNTAHCNSFTRYYQITFLKLQYSYFHQQHTTEFSLCPGQHRGLVFFIINANLVNKIWHLITPLTCIFQTIGEVEPLFIYLLTIQTVFYELYLRIESYSFLVHFYIDFYAFSDQFIYDRI